MNASDELFDALLSILETEDTGSWTGYLHDLDSKTLAIALWHIVTGQYLHILE